MDRNFFIPIAVAAGAHSFLFFSGTPAERPLKSPVDRIETVIREVILPPIDPELLEPADSVQSTSDKPPPPFTPDVPTPFDPERISQRVDLIDMVPRPGNPDVSRIDSGWSEALDNSRKQKGIFIIDGDFLDNPPATRFQPAPTYPRELKSTRIDGSVTVTFSVDVNGSVFNASVTRASHELFGEEALRAVRKWRFEPGLKDGKRVPFRMIQTFSFTLSE